LQIGVAGMQQENNPDYGLRMASACVAAVPMVAVFLVFQKYFTSGITMGAVKE
jgi:multiple sugar transport system permease protein